MLKSGQNFLTMPLYKLFNVILKSGCFPKSWGTSILVPLHKKGYTTDVNNYRGIAISSCISKVLTKIMNQRIYKYGKENNIFSENQSGFMESQV